MTFTIPGDGQLYTGGKHADASGGQRLDITDPSTGSVIGTVADDAPEDVSSAVAAARGGIRRRPLDTDVRPGTGARPRRWQAARPGH